MDAPNGDEERWVRCDWRIVFLFSRNEIDYELRDEMMRKVNELRSILGWTLILSLIISV